MNNTAWIKIVAALKEFNSRTIVVLKKTFVVLNDILKVISTITSDARDLVYAALGLASVVAFILVIRGCNGCSSPRPLGEGTGARSPLDTNFVAIQHIPISASAKALKKEGAKIPANVPASTVSKVVQIKLKTGDTLQVVISALSPSNPLQGGAGVGSGGGQVVDIYVAKDSMIESVTVLDVQPPLFRFGLYPALGVSLALQGEGYGEGVKFSPSASLAFLRIGKSCVPIIAADLTGLGAGAGYEILPNIQLAALYCLQFSGTRAIKLGAYYEF